MFRSAVFICSSVYLGKEVGGVCPVHVSYWGHIVSQIQNPKTFMREMVLATRVKPVIRVETAIGRGIGPLKESKMPFTNHMSGVT